MYKNFKKVFIFFMGLVFIFNSYASDLNISDEDYRLKVATSFSLPNLSCNFFEAISLGSKKSYLSEVNNFFSDTIVCDNKAKPSRILNIYGMPGVGKTALALMYAYNCFLQEDYRFIGWINGKSKEEIVKKYKRFSEIFEIKYVDFLDNKKFFKVLSKKNKILLIFDDLPLNHVLSDVLPSNYTGDIILTSRTKLENYHGLALHCFTSQESIQYLKRGLESSLVLLPEDKKYIKIIVKKLGYLPLALTHFFSKFNCMNCLDLSFNKYIQDFLKLESKNYDEIKPYKILGNFYHTTYRNFQNIAPFYRKEINFNTMILKTIKGFLKNSSINLEQKIEKYAQFMFMASYIGYNNISEHYFSGDQNLYKLYLSSLITLEHDLETNDFLQYEAREYSAFSINPFVQFICRRELEKREPAQIMFLLNGILQEFQRYVTWKHENLVENMEEKSLILGHLGQFYDHLDRLDLTRPDLAVKGLPALKIDTEIFLSSLKIQIN